MTVRSPKLLNYYLGFLGFFLMVYNCNTSAMTTQKPLDLLISQYQQNRILAFGESNHSKYQSLEYLIELLKVHEIGFDPELKVIATEFSHETSEFLERNSVSLSPIEQQGVPFYFSQNKHEGYYWQVFLPFLRDLNLRRKEKGLEPVLVKGIDGYPSDDYPKDVERATGYLHCGLFWNRENSTAHHFKEMAHSILNDPKGKIIVFYHILHLAFLPTEKLEKVSSQSMEPDWKLEELENTPGNWLSMVFQNHPEWRIQTAIVLFEEDYGILGSDWREKPITRIALHLIEQESSKKAFGVSLRVRRDELSSSEQELFDQRGKAVFNLEDRDRSDIGELGTHLQSQTSVAEMIDAIIWTPDTTGKDLHQFE